MEKDIYTIIATALEIDESAINADSVADDFPEWDSLGHLTILSELDENFKELTVSFPEVAVATSVKEILDVCQKWQVNNPSC